MLLLFILFLLLLSALFSGSEIAFISANKLGIEVIKNRGHERGKIIAAFYEKHLEFMSTMLVGNNIVLVVLTIFATDLLNDYINPYIPEGTLLYILVTTLIITVVVLIFGEFLPKVFSKMFSNELLYKFAYILKFLIIILKPATWFFTFISNLFLKRVFKVSHNEAENVLSKLDLQEYIDESVSEEEDIDKEILTNALNLSTLRVKDCLIPRNEIIYVDKNASVDEAINLFKTHKISRIIVVNDEIESVVGYIHHQQMLTNPKRIDKLPMPIGFIPEAMALPDAMRKFIHERTNIAMVVNEFGGISGLITLEDILEEIFGEIEDEHDIEQLIDEQISEDSYRFAGRLEIDYINEKYDLDLPIGEYQTLSGYIVSEEENIPRQGDEISIGVYKFIIESVSDTRIDVVKVEKIHSDLFQKQPIEP
jgi:CBS domain containing-hemolysin-like protein